MPVGSLVSPKSMPLVSPCSEGSANHRACPSVCLLGQREATACPSSLKKLARYLYITKKILAFHSQSSATTEQTRAMHRDGGREALEELGGAMCTDGREDRETARRRVNGHS